MRAHETPLGRRAFLALIHDLRAKISIMAANVRDTGCMTSMIKDTHAAAHKRLGR